MTRLYEKNHEDEPVFREIENDNSLGSLSSITQEELRTKLTQQHSRIKKLLENVAPQESSDTDENENRTLFGVDDQEEGEIDEEGMEEAFKNIFGEQDQEVAKLVINEHENTTQKTRKRPVFGGMHGEPTAVTENPEEYCEEIAKMVKQPI